MRSLYTRLLLALLAVLLLSTYAFYLAFRAVTGPNIVHMINGSQRAESAEAAIALQRGGTRAVADVITDFDQGANERMLLNLVDANTVAGGNQAFTFIGTGAFTGVAGQLHYVHQGVDTYVEGDLDGDSVADIFIRLDGLHNLVAGDFVL